MDVSPLFKSLEGGASNMSQQPPEISNLGYPPPTLPDDSPPAPTTLSASNGGVGTTFNPNQKGLTAVPAPLDDNQSHTEEKLALQQIEDCALPSDAHRDDLTTTTNRLSLPPNLLQLMNLVPFLSEFWLYNRMRRLTYPTQSSRNPILPTESETPYHDEKSSAVEDMEEWAVITIVSDNDFSLKVQKSE